MKRYTFCYSKSGYITVDANDEDEAERLAEQEEIEWNDYDIDNTMTIIEEIEEDK